MDISLGKEVLRVLKKQGIEFFLNHAVQKAVVNVKNVEFTATYTQTINNELNTNIAIACYALLIIDKIFIILFITITLLIID